MMKRWESVPLGQIATPVSRSEIPSPEVKYPLIGIRLWGQGAYAREVITGAETKYPLLYRVLENDIVVNKIWARNGSVGVIPANLEDGFVSSEFPTFTPDLDKLDPHWFNWITRADFFWKRCEIQSRGTSGQNRIRPEKFLKIEIPLPPLEEQQRIVAHLNAVQTQLEQARELHKQNETDLILMLRAQHQRITEDAPMRRMSEVAPLVRRPVKVESGQHYPEMGVRSFGKGTFHKPVLTTEEVGSKSLYYIQSGDLVFQIVFAWEGAIAIAQPEDAGRVGSHRFLTCVPQSDLATSEYLKWYFLSPSGLEKIAKASPGGAGRNRTLGLKALENIEVPVPSFWQQQQFTELCKQHKILEQQHGLMETELDAVMPAMIERVFSNAI